MQSDAARSDERPGRVGARGVERGARDEAKVQLEGSERRRQRRAAEPRVPTARVNGGACELAASSLWCSLLFFSEHLARARSMPPRARPVDAGREPADPTTLTASFDATHRWQMTHTPDYCIAAYRYRQLSLTERHLLPFAISSSNSSAELRLATHRSRAPPRNTPSCRLKERARVFPHH